MLKAAADLAPDGIKFEMVKINSIAFYNEDTDNENRPIPISEYLNKINGADVILFASPEYNHGMSGVLKNAIDWASRPAFQSPLLNKSCGILTASKSPVGGARAQADLKKRLIQHLKHYLPC